LKELIEIPASRRRNHIYERTAVVCESVDRRYVFDITSQNRSAGVAQVDWESAELVTLDNRRRIDGEAGTEIRDSLIHDELAGLCERARIGSFCKTFSRELKSSIAVFIALATNYEIRGQEPFAGQGQNLSLG
jgi:hypothetical protein